MFRTLQRATQKAGPDVAAAGDKRAEPSASTSRDLEVEKCAGATALDNSDVTNGRVMTCDLCGFTYSALTNHRRVHSQVNFRSGTIKEYSCGICSMYFSRQATLKMLMVTHACYSCDACAEGFMEMSELVKHEADIHGSQPAPVCVQAAKGRHRAAATCGRQ